MKRLRKYYDGIHEPVFRLLFLGVEIAIVLFSFSCALSFFPDGTPLRALSPDFCELGTGVCTVTALILLIGEAVCRDAEGKR